MPEPGGRGCGKQRARRRGETERSGVFDRHADEEADEPLRRDPHRRSPGRGPGGG